MRADRYVSLLRGEELADHKLQRIIGQFRVVSIRVVLPVPETFCRLCYPALWDTRYLLKNGRAVADQLLVETEEREPELIIITRLNEIVRPESIIGLMVNPTLSYVRYYIYNRDSAKRSKCNYSQHLKNRIKS